MDYDAVANNVIMNQLCKVCGEPAAGFHFGAFTCEGCKSFFGRTYNNISSISECKNNGECVINKRIERLAKPAAYANASWWEQQQQAGVHMAGNLLRPHPYLSPLFRHPPSINPAVTRDTTSGRSSESDSGASSADPEDDLRSTSALSYLKPSASPSSDRGDFYSNKKLSPSSDSEFLARKKSASVPLHTLPIYPASLPSVSPSGVVPKWLPPVQGICDPSTWRDLWLKPPPSIAAPAPDQDQPIDLSVKANNTSNVTLLPTTEKSDSDQEELSIDVGGGMDDDDEPVKSAPLDLTLDRQVTNVAN